MEKMIYMCKGILIGVALVAPGLSGSIFAVTVGLYGKIIDAANHLREKESQRFLIPLAIGCLIGILMSAKLILWLCQNYTYQAYSFFIGLVVGSIPLAVRKIRQIPFRSPYLGITVIGFLFLLLISTFGVGQEAAKAYVAVKEIEGVGQFLQIILAGVFSCFFMTIPGVSGSIMLMAVKQYGSVYYAVSNLMNIPGYLVHGDASGISGAWQSLALCGVFAVGAGIGFYSAAKFLNYMLSRYESLIYYGVLGLLIAAAMILYLGGVYPYVWESPGIPISATRFMLIGIMILIGFGCATFMKENHE